MERHMSEQNGKIARPWQEIAAEVEKEKDSKRLTELIAELNAALDSQVISPPRKSTTHY